MTFRMQDFICKDCGMVSEILLDKRSNAEPETPQCEHCDSANVEPVLSISDSKGGHISWSKWRV